MGRNFRFRIEIAVTDFQRNFIKNCAWKEKKSISQFLLDLVFKNYSFSKKDNEKFKKENQRIIDLEVNRYRWKRKLFAFYMIPNAVKNICDISKKYFIITGKIPMNAVRSLIVDVKKTYNCLPDEIKKELDDHIADLDRYNDIDAVKKMLNIERIEKRTGIKWEK